MFAVVWILLKWDVHLGILEICIYGAGFFTAVSGFLYVFDGIKQLSVHPASSATEK
jgi:hypothetical protein